MVDALKRKLRVPSRFVPYMEKHRLYELFNEMVTQLVMKQPRDHIQFLKDKIQEENVISRYTPKVIILAPLDFDKGHLATLISASTGAYCISLRDILDDESPGEELSSTNLDVSESYEFRTSQIDSQENSFIRSYEPERTSRSTNMGEPLTKSEVVASRPTSRITNMGEPLIKSEVVASRPTSRITNMDERLTNPEVVASRPTSRITNMSERLTNSEAVASRPTSRITNMDERLTNSEVIASRTSQITNMDELLPNLDEVTSRTSQIIGSNEKLINPELAIATRIRQIIDSSAECVQHGWILYDFPRNRDEALALQNVGVLPTHTILFFPSSLPERMCSSYISYTSLLNKKFPKDDPETKEKTLEYRRNLLGLRDVYKLTLHEVETRGRDIEELAQDCCKLIRMQKHAGAPMLPRVLIIGPRGSGRKTQAKLLCYRYNVIHVEFEVLVERTKLEDNHLGHKVRLREYRHLPIEDEVLAGILEKRILERDCLDHGWVLTGYPENVAQFKLLDLMDTPPNRVIFLEVEPIICYERIAQRYYNVHTGSQHNLLKKQPNDKSTKHIVKHPKDLEAVVYKQINHYLCHLPELLKYSRGTETRIDGSASLQTVKEKVQAVIIRPPPDVFPRDYVMPEVSMCFEITPPLSESEVEEEEDLPETTVTNIVNEILENVIEEVDTVDEIIDDFIDNVLDKVDHSHIDSVLTEVLQKTVETARNKRLPYDVKHECLAFVRGTPHSKHTYTGSEYGKWVVAQENAIRQRELEAELAGEMSEIDSYEEQKSDADMLSVNFEGEMLAECNRPHDSTNPLLTFSEMEKLIFYNVKGLEDEEEDLPNVEGDDEFRLDSSYLISTAIVDELITAATEDRVIDLKNIQCHADLQNTENDPTQSEMDDITNEIELNSIGVRLGLNSIPSFKKVSLEITLEPVPEDEEMHFERPVESPKEVVDVIPEVNEESLV